MALRELVDDGYIFVFQDIRGKFKSEGEFVMQRPPRDPADPKGIDEGTDAYDTIDWLVKMSPATTAASACWASPMTAGRRSWRCSSRTRRSRRSRRRPCRPTCSSATTSTTTALPPQLWLRVRRAIETTKGKQLRVRPPRHLRVVSEPGTAPTADEKYFHGKMPTWNDFVHHPNYDAFWQNQAFEPFHTPPKVPTLNVAGWWDQEDFYGPLKIYETWRSTTRGLRHFVVGPWNHGGWSADRRPSGADPVRSPDREALPREGPASVLRAPPQGRLAWGRNSTSRRGRGDVGIEPGPHSRGIGFGPRRMPGAYDHWPPGDVDAPALLRPGRATALVRRGRGPDAPLRRVCLRPGAPGALFPPGRSRRSLPIASGRWLVEDQRFVNVRPDVLSWETEPSSRN